MTRLVKSAHRTIGVFEYFAKVRHAATATEIEEAMDWPQSSTSMLLRSLVELGYLEFRPEGRLYFPSVRFASLGHWLENDSEIGFFTRKMEELHDLTEETIILGARMGIQIKYIQILRSSRAIQFFMPEGTRHPICTSASGRLLLSNDSDEDINRIVRRHNLGATGKDLRVDPESLQEKIEHIRRTGISETDPNLGGAKEYHAIAIMVPQTFTSNQYSIGVVGPRSRMVRRRERITEVLRNSLAA